MAAGLSQKQISGRVRYRLQSLASEHGGEYVPATATTAAMARGMTEDGIEWSATYGVSRASNGETSGIPSYTVGTGDVRQVYSGLHGGLRTALDTFRADRDGILGYVVAHGGSTGAEIDAPEDAVTHDLGQARWAQQQTGNMANLWLASLADSGKARILREFGYTDPVGHAAMDAYMEANGLDIYEAQKTLATHPALAIIDARVPTLVGPGRQL